ncbi:MAG: hypothetical protein RBS40_15265 [Rhodocyclaceae bacterium]|jgi:signal transduction histidine kinase|nr:hypothetical protein [Rhodocyclaceae bacterium]
MVRCLIPSWLLARPHWLLAACLGVLHLGLLQGLGNLAGRMFFLAHFGLFLIWQPLVQSRHRFGPRDLLLLLAAALALALEASQGFATVWMMVLAAMVAGGSFRADGRAARWSYRLAVAYLILAIILGTLPDLLPGARDEVARMDGLRQFLLPALLVAVALLPVPPVGNPGGGAIDLLSALLVFMALAMIFMGGMAFMWLAGQPYLVALPLALFATAAVLLLLAWVWDPGLGGEGLGLKLSRRLLASGVSFDEWLARVAGLALEEQEPLGFLERACGTLMAFPGVLGGRGEVDGGQFRFGVPPTGEGVVVRQDGLLLRLALGQPPGSALLWHLNLAVQVIQEFHREKELSRRLQTLSYLEAVHRTGARLTHDVKNLLQSLEALCFAAARPEASPAQVQALVQRQLPVVAQRLQQTLEKLRQPEVAEEGAGSLASWWGELQERYQGAGIDFACPGEGVVERRVPVAVFRSVVDNLIQNALDKRLGFPALGIRVALDGAGGVEVADDGPALPEALAGVLFHQPVTSENGFGMGLYHSAMLARQAGLSLSLVVNRPGSVVFRLAQAAAEARRADS